MGGMYVYVYARRGAACGGVAIPYHARTPREVYTYVPAYMGRARARARVHVGVHVRMSSTWCGISIHILTTGVRCIHTVLHV